MAIILNETITESGELILSEGNSSPAQNWCAAIFQLTLSDNATDALADKLDVSIQHSVDGGETWTSFITFTQLAGNSASGTTEQKTWSLYKDNPVGSAWKVVWTVTKNGPTATFPVVLQADITPKGRLEPSFLASYDPTASGLTATSVQAAIDETVEFVGTQIDLELAAYDIDAADVTYDNQVSGLTAADVKAAIDELKALIDAL